AVVVADKTPNLFLSVLPLFSLIGSIFLMSKTPNVLAIGLLVYILLSALIFYPYLPNQKEILNASTTASIVPAFATS
ncbi:GntP family permease, partial [Streptococcus suis]